MNVYQVEGDYDAYRGLVADSPDALNQIMSQPQGEAFGTTWRPARFKRRTEGNRAERPDGHCVDLGLTGIGLSRVAVAAVAEHFERCGELLPLDVEGDTSSIVWFHPTTVVDAFDEAHSEFKRSSSTGRIGIISTYAFLKERLSEAMLLFLLPQSRSALFCTDTFKQVIERSGLTGLRFLLRWSDEPEGIERMRKWAGAMPWQKSR